MITIWLRRFAYPAAIIGSLSSAVIANYVITEVHPLISPLDFYLLLIGAVILLVVTWICTQPKSSTSSIIILLYITGIIVFFAIWSPKDLAQRTICCSGSVNDIALQINSGTLTVTDFTLTYYTNVLVNRTHAITAVPNYNIPDNPMMDLRRTSLASHPPGVIAPYIVGNWLGTWLHLPRSVYGSAVILILLRALIAPAVFFGVYVMTGKKGLAVGSALVIISSPIYYVSTGFSDGAVAGCVAVALSLLLAAIIQPNSRRYLFFLSGIFMAISAYMTYGILTLLVAMVLLILLTSNTYPSKPFVRFSQIFVFLLPVAIVITGYNLLGFDYLHGLPLAIKQNIFLDYSSKIPYLPALIGNSETIFVVTGLLLSSLVLVYLIKVLGTLPRWLIIVLLICSTYFWALYAIPLTPQAQLGTTGPYFGWFYYLPMIVVLLTLWVRHNHPEFKEQSLLTPHSILFISTLIIMFAPLITGTVRGELWRTAFFLYPILLITSITGLKEIFISKLSVSYFAVYTVCFLLILRFTGIPG